LINEVQDRFKEQKIRLDNKKILLSIQNRFSESKKDIEGNKIKSLLYQPGRRLIKHGHMILKVKEFWVLCEIYLLKDFLFLINCDGKIIFFN
jgi:hypothetical protein